MTTPPTLFLVCAILAAGTATGEPPPAATPAAAAPAGEPAFQELQSVIHSLLAKTSRPAASSGAPSQLPADRQRVPAAAAASPAAPGAAAAPGGPVTAEDYHPASTSPTTGRNDTGEHTDTAWDVGDPAVHNLLAQGSADLAYLQDLSTRIAVPAAYAESVREHKAVLFTLEAEDRLTAQGFAKLQAVTADLHIKALHAQKIESAVFSPIEVRVHTFRQGKEVSGYEVWFVGAAYDDDPSRFQRFLRLSSPTTRPLTVGNYSMWVTVPGGATSAHQVLGIGAGTPTQDLDLVFP